MADNLPALKANQDLAVDKPASNSLLGRGLAAIQNKQLVIANQDKRYRKARDIYDQITDYGWERRFDPDLLPKQGLQINIFEACETSEIQPWIDKTNQLAQVFRELKQLADEGYGKAYFPLTLIYMGGQGISQNIEKTKFYSQLAFTWCFDSRFNKAEEDPEIWLDLGDLYNYGYWTEHDNFEQDDTEAVLLYQDAAEYGHVRGQFKLGAMYQDGCGVGQSLIDAAAWYREAAKQGYAGAQYRLGSMYESGQGVEQDDEKAAFWIRKAAEQGHAIAQFQMANMREYDNYCCESDEDGLLIKKDIYHSGIISLQSRVMLMPNMK